MSDFYRLIQQADSLVCSNKHCPGFKIQKLVPFLLEKFTVATVVSKVLVWWCKECEQEKHFDIL
jgi:hypothetical protein